jgi:riboflavin kinase
VRREAHDTFARTDGFLPLPPRVRIPRTGRPDRHPTSEKLSIFVTLKPASVVAEAMAEQVTAVGPDELAALKQLALEGAADAPTTVTCAAVAERLDASNQTASRRLQRLEDAGTIEREMLGDGQRVTITDAGRRTLRREYEQYRRVFEQTTEVSLHGTITSGMGEGRHYISLPGYMEQFRDRLGYEPFAGTLNVDLDAESVEARARMDSLDPVRIDGWEDEDRTYGPAFCWPATVEADGDPYEPAHVIAPERTHHGADQLEVIAPDKLRETLGLDDGQEVTIRVEEQ